MFNLVFEIEFLNEAKCGTKITTLKHAETKKIMDLKGCDLHFPTTGSKYIETLATKWCLFLDNKLRPIVSAPMCNLFL